MHVAFSFASPCKRFHLALALLLLLALGAPQTHAATHEASSRPTYANPVDVDYRYNYEQMNEGISYRTGADPAVVYFKGAYYLFQTLADGYWRSTDLAHWTFVKPDKWPFDSEVAPATLVADGKLFLMRATMRPEPLLFSTDPKSGHWDFWSRWLPMVPKTTWPGKPIQPGRLPSGPWDPGLFQDDDGKVYLYWGSSNVHPLYGIQMNLALDKAAEGEGKRITYPGEPVTLFGLHPEQHGWERFGRDHSNTTIAPYIEGAWMNKHGGRYYLQYAAPGTEYNVYATGVYTSDKPLGPFHYAPYNPIGYKPGGFTQGAGHGSSFQGAHGNWWNTGTSWIGTNWTFERRIGLYPAGFTADGQMWVNTRFGDFPHYVPDHKLKPGESTFTGWMLLSYHKHATASSQIADHGPALATDEDPRTFWVAAKNAPGQTLTVDLGGPRTVRAVQVNYADYKAGRYGDAPDIVTRFRLLGSVDGTHWHMLADLSKSQRGRADAYLPLKHAQTLRYIRYVHIHVGSKHLAIADLRVFGNEAGPPPPAPVLLSAKRLADTRDAQITWKPVPGAVGYNVRWGLAKDRLFETYQRFADQPTTLKLTSLNKGVRYVVAVEAFDERGVSTLSKTMVLKP